MSQRLIEFVNPNPYEVELVGPDRVQRKVGKHARVVLEEWYKDRYVPKYLRVVRYLDNPSLANVGKPPTKKRIPTKKPRQQINRSRNKAGVTAQKKPKPPQPASKSKPSTPKEKSQKTAPTAQSTLTRAKNNQHRAQARAAKRREIRERKRRRVVGRAVPGDWRKLYVSSLEGANVPISNDIAVGILSYNRLHCVQRLIESIRRHSDLNRLAVFVSDESDDPAVKTYLRQQNDICLIDNTERLGIAGNSNRLMRALRRFKYKFLLNDDVEILAKGWEDFYINAADKSGYHHFCYRQPGVYGAKESDGTERVIAGQRIRTITDKPHGAVMFFDNLAQSRVGFFDESFGTYGMEHVDWSNRVGLSGIQPRGFHDAVGASKFFRIHKETSSTSKQSLSEAKQLYKRYQNDTTRIHVTPTKKSDIPKLSVIIPVRVVPGRSAKGIVTVVNNLKAQRFPEVEIIVVEQDTSKQLKDLNPTIHHLARSFKSGQPFTKSMAFNLGVKHSTADRVVLHDGDLLAQGDYLTKVYYTLNSYKALHIGEYVMYYNKSATEEIFKTGSIYKSLGLERVVGYFEGGSLACHKKTYIDVGGFNEIFIGYGVEDCEFFARLREGSGEFYDTRSVSFYHLWHGRSTGWEECHRKNKRILAGIQRKQNRHAHMAELRELLRRKYNM